MANSPASRKPARVKPLSRRECRRKAFELLFELEQHPGLAGTAALTRSFEAEIASNYATDADAEGYVAGIADADAQRFIEELVMAVDGHRAALDQELMRYPHAWSYDRIGLVERVLLRMALAEIAVMGTAEKVVINEGVELAKMYADEEAAKFINGILGSVVTNIDRIKVSLT